MHLRFLSRPLAVLIILSLLVNLGYALPFAESRPPSAPCCFSDQAVVPGLIQAAFHPDNYFPTVRVGLVHQEAAATEFGQAPRRFSWRGFAHPLGALALTTVLFLPPLQAAGIGQFYDDMHPNIILFLEVVIVAILVSATIVLGERGWKRLMRAVHSRYSPKPSDPPLSRATVSSARVIDVTYSVIRSEIATSQPESSRKRPVLRPQQPGSSRLRLALEKAHSEIFLDGSDGWRSWVPGFIAERSNPADPWRHRYLPTTTHERVWSEWLLKGRNLETIAKSTGLQTDEIRAIEREILRNVAVVALERLTEDYSLTLTPATLLSDDAAAILDLPTLTRGRLEAIGIRTAGDLARMLRSGVWPKGLADHRSKTLHELRHKMNINLLLRLTADPHAAPGDAIGISDPLLGLQVRTRNGLTNNQEVLFFTLTQVASLIQTDEDAEPSEAENRLMWRTKNFGIVALKDLRRALHRFYTSARHPDPLPAIAESA